MERIASHRIVWARMGRVRGMATYRFVVPSRRNKRTRGNLNLYVCSETFEME